jgi:fumarate hydratase class II
VALPEFRIESDSLGQVSVPADRPQTQRSLQIFRHRPRADPREMKIAEYVERSLMLVTALLPVIGYDKAAAIAHHAATHNQTLKEAALELGFGDEATFDRVVDPAKMGQVIRRREDRLSRRQTTTAADPRPRLPILSKSGDKGRTAKLCRHDLFSVRN